MTNAELAILSLVAESPRYGYEIEQTIEERGMREWTEVGFSSIYYLLKKLEKSGLVKSQLQKSESRGPSRKVYQVTSLGRKAHAKAVIETFAVARSGYTLIMTGIANLPVLSLEQSVEVLNNYRQQLSIRKANVASAAQAQRPLPEFVEYLFDYSLTMIDAELIWIQKFIARLESHNA